MNEMGETLDEYRIDISSVNHVELLIIIHIIFISSSALQVSGGLGTANLQLVKEP
jgi:hypothetical protein